MSAYAMKEIRSRSRTTSATLLATAMAVAVVALSGCTKPPDCANAQVIELAQQVFNSGKDELKKEVTDDPNHLLDRFFAGVTYSFDAVVNDGYDANAKKQTCKANVTALTPAGNLPPVSQSYIVQSTAGQSGQFVVNSTDILPVFGPVAEKAAGYYLAHRFAGTWGGIYSCAETSGSSDDADRGFKQDVAMVVDVDEATLERSTASGGFEKLTGTVASGRRLYLSGQIQVSPTERWDVNFDGRINGNVYTATGGPNGFEGRGARRACKLQLTLQPTF